MRSPRPPRPPRDAARPGRAKSPSASARDARRAADHALLSGRAAGKGTGKTAEKPANGSRDKTGRPERAARPVRDERTAGGERPMRTGRPARDDRAAPAERTGRPVRPPRSANSARNATAVRPERADHEGRPARVERPRRGAGRLAPVLATVKATVPVAPGEGERIAKLLARAGIASRREIERMVAEGRIAIGDKIVDTPATILKSLQGVTVDGKPVAPPEHARLFRFHKPTGLLTAERDPKGRATIYDRLPRGLPRVVPVGRLDLNTEGLLLLTTDGGLKRQLELPSTGVERTYRARVFGEVTQTMLDDLIEGIEIEGVRYGSIDANLERRTGRNGWVEMKLREGKNREVRRVLEHLGLQVSRLIRTSYGPFRLGDLPVGAVDEVLQHDLVNFRKTLK